ncbi:unnamed protein product [Coregonus sp. 'balchen']|nr:unnamed protein product [Coregonus sp. 'balchen']
MGDRIGDWRGQDREHYRGQDRGLEWQWQGESHAHAPALADIIGGGGVGEKRGPLPEHGPMGQTQADPDTDPLCVPASVSSAQSYMGTLVSGSTTEGLLDTTTEAAHPQRKERRGGEEEERREEKEERRGEERRGEERRGEERRGEERRGEERREREREREREGEERRGEERRGEERRGEERERRGEERRGEERRGEERRGEERRGEERRGEGGGEKEERRGEEREERRESRHGSLSGEARVTQRHTMQSVVEQKQKAPTSRAVAGQNGHKPFECIDEQSDWSPYPDGPARNKHLATEEEEEKWEDGKTHACWRTYTSHTALPGGHRTIGFWEHKGPTELNHRRRTHSAAQPGRRISFLRATLESPLESISPDQWQAIVNKKFNFPPELIAAIKEDNSILVESLLSTGDGIIRQLDESEDRLWREALNLSIRLGNEDTFSALMLGIKFDFRQIYEALLVAVDTNQPRVVKRLLDRLDQEKGNKMDVRSFSMAIFDHSIDDSQFAPGVTPLTLAGQKDLYEIVTMLTKKGHVIPLPHSISCTCLECRNGRQYDLLKFSLSRINTYRGIASRAYLSITTEDAMLSAFRLSLLMYLYLSLEELCQEFAVEMLAMCRNQSEVTTILNNCDDDDEDELDEQTFEEGIPTLSRLRLAVNYNQKLFVSHPICQQVLSSIWCGNIPGWRGSKTVWKLTIGKTLKIPVIKFLLHSASYLWFIIALLAESIFMELYRDEFASRQQNILYNSLHMIWVVGFFWSECKNVWAEGLRGYMVDWSNILDIVALSMYLASFALRVFIMATAHNVCQDKNLVEKCAYFTQTVRDEWWQEDPQLISEILFAVTSMFSFTRLAYILPAHESLGTLQISIGIMIDDMMRFMFILMIIGTAFLCGLNNIYVPYATSPHLGRFNETFNFLFWTMFGVSNQGYTDMPDFVLAQFVGRVLYGVFTLVIVIILLNMLIAMITNSFQKIEDDADVEWKFARSKLYLSYFREGSTIPVPFNLIPSPKALFYLLRGFCCCCNQNKTPDYPPIASVSNSTMNDSGEAGKDRVSFRLQVVKALVQRYIEAARREFGEATRKDVGNRITELNKVVGRLHSDIKQFHQNLQNSKSFGSNSNGGNFLGKYIKGAKNNFKNFDKNEAMGNSPDPLRVAVHLMGKVEGGEKEVFTEKNAHTNNSGSSPDISPESNSGQEFLERETESTCTQGTVEKNTDTMPGEPLGRPQPFITRSPEAQRPRARSSMGLGKDTTVLVTPHPLDDLFYTGAPVNKKQ